MTLKAPILKGNKSCIIVDRSFRILEELVPGGKIKVAGHNRGSAGGGGLVGAGACTHYRTPEASVGGVAWLWWCHVLLESGACITGGHKRQWVVLPGRSGAMFCYSLAGTGARITGGQKHQWVVSPGCGDAMFC